MHTHPRILGIVLAAACALPALPAVATDVPARAPIVAVIDTGADLSHPVLAGRLWEGSDGMHGWNFVDDTPDPSDRSGHGTAVAGAIALASPEARLMILKVGDSARGLQLDEVAKAIAFAVREGADVVNLSITAPIAPVDLRAAVAYARRQGVILVAAAGNEGTATADLPGSLPGVVRVGALDGAIVPAFSNRHPDIVAPGVSIPGARAAGVACSEFAALGASSCTPEDQTLSFTGTSFAAAHVSGFAASLRAAHPGLTGDHFETLLRATARDLGDPVAAGAGAVDEAAVHAALGAPTLQPASASAGRALTRGEFLDRLLAARGVEPTASIAANLVFDAFHSPHLRAIATAKSLGLIRGRWFSPDERITRAEALELASRLVPFPNHGAALLVSDVVLDEQRVLLAGALAAGVGAPWNDRELNQRLRTADAATLLAEISAYDPARAPF